MKIITVGDIHGRTNWKKVPDGDIQVFIGDYTDSFNVKDLDILENLKEIIEYKKTNPDGVILLWGNHDVQYALQPPGSNNRHYASGYRSMMHWDLYPLFRDNFDLFQVAYQYDNYLWTHAGVHKGWHINRFLSETGHDPEMCPLADKLNMMLLNKDSCLFDVGHIRGGFLPVGGPLWLHKFPARKYLEGYHQIIGHTVTKSIHTETLNEFTSVTFVDVLDKKDSFYAINIQDMEKGIKS